MFFKSQIQILTEQLAKAEARAEAAEIALAHERDQRMADVRHIMSMWLRHSRSLPLPPTIEEKAEASAKTEAEKNAPRPLTDVEVAMRDANRRAAAAAGIDEEQADRDFEAKILNRMMESLE